MRMKEFGGTVVLRDVKFGGTDNFWRQLCPRTLC